MEAHTEDLLPPEDDVSEAESVTPEGPTPVEKAEPLTPKQRATRQRAIKDHWRDNAVTSGFDGPPEDKQVKGPARKK